MCARDHHRLCWIVFRAYTHNSAQRAHLFLQIVFDGCVRVLGSCTRVYYLLYSTCMCGEGTRIEFATPEKKPCVWGGGCVVLTLVLFLMLWQEWPRWQEAVVVFVVLHTRTLKIHTVLGTTVRVRTMHTNKERTRSDKKRHNRSRCAPSSSGSQPGALP